MQQIRIGYGVRGFARLADYAIRWQRMVTDKAKQRARILAFWDKHGLEATVEAFDSSRRTLYLWKAKWRSGQGKFEALNEKSTRPKKVRKREWPDAVKSEICRLRAEHPNLGKTKVQVLLKRFCEAKKLPCPSTATIGNLIRDMGGLRTFKKRLKYNGLVEQIKKRPRIRKPKHFVAERPGHCVALDTVERFVLGLKRYIVTFTDTYSRFSFAAATTSHGSLFAKDFFQIIQDVFPYPIENVLTDNGSEFMKHFDLGLRQQAKEHWHTYPRTPKMNAHCERFNRTIQEEFVDWNDGLLADTGRFNDKLMDWLVWYNAERPHFALKNRSPLEFLTNKHPEECKMYLAINSRN